MRTFLTLFVLLFFALSTLTAQKGLAGLWEGTLTWGGLHNTQTYKFELLIQVEGNKVRGRSYIHLPEGEVLEMDVRGYFYQDRSIAFRDIEFIPPVGSELDPRFYRKYQLIYNRSIFGSTLEGYWQEIITSPFDEYRDRGKITLKKKDASKA